MAFLDFENYFNTISLPALFMILRKLSLPEADVSALERYYASSYMQIAHSDGQKSANIPLGRGLRQGCPLSPILGGMVVNAMLRWVEQQGGGVRHSSGVETNVLAFADDATLLTEETGQMAKLMQCVHEFCKWAGVNINLGKSEVTGYDFARMRPINTNALRIGGGRPKHILPDTPFKYLGIRLTILGDMSAEREYVLQKSAALGKMLKDHPYHPRQMHLVVQTAIVPIFRYSAAVAQWTSTDLAQLWNIWCRALKHAWKLKPSTPAGFFHSAEWAGLDVHNPAEILVKETAGMMEQCFVTPGDLGDMLKMEWCELVQDLGCSSTEELQRHLRVSQPPHPPDTFCYHFLTHMAPSATIEWSTVLTELREEDYRAGTRTVCGNLGAPGLLTLMNDANEVLDANEKVAATRALLGVASMGFHRLSAVLEERTLWLPEVARPDNDSCKALQKLTTHLGISLRWTEAGNGRTIFRDLLARIRPGDTGQDLVQSRVRIKEGRAYKWGTVRSFSPDHQTYEIDMQDRSRRQMTHDQLCANWMPPVSHSTWTNRDQLALGSCIRRIIGSKSVDVVRQLRTPHPTLLTSGQWNARSTWYMCEITYAFPPSVTALFARRWSLEADRQIAMTLCDNQVVFWAPKNVWNWQSTSSSNRAGWVVQATSVIEKAKGVVLVVRSLHQDEHHREGEIWVSSTTGPSLRSIHKAHQGRVQAPVISLSAAEVGDEEGAQEPCAALKYYRKGLPRTSNVSHDPPVYPPITRRKYSQTELIPSVQFDIDMSAMKPVDMSFMSSGKSVQVTRHHGQAFIGSKMHEPVKKSLKDGGGRRLKQRGSFHIDEGRLALLRLWSQGSDMISNWKREWQQLETWETMGGRTIHWAITAHLQEHYGALTAVYAHWLAADPSFDHYVMPDEPPRPGVTFLPLYEMSSDVAVQVLTKYARSSWVAIVRVEKRSKIYSKVKSLGQLRQAFKKGDRIKLQKSWWKTGERVPIKSDCEYEIWCSTTFGNRVIPDIEVATMRWMPSETRETSSRSLRTYLGALPGAKYRTSGRVLATDGSLRTRKRSTGEFSMGAGVAGVGGDALRISVKVGGQFSSTRAELVAIVLALQASICTQSLAVLVDSSAALQRLAWCRSQDFRPSPRRIKDLDVVRDIVSLLQRRQEAGKTTTLVKVHGHSGDPLHQLADQLAVIGADMEDTETEYVAGRPDCILYAWAQGTKGCRHPWGPQIKTRIKQVTGKETWAARKCTGAVDEFQSRPNAGRALLGSALRGAWDWAVRGWILGVTPHSYPVQSNISKWRNSGSGTCLCGQGPETFAHLQLCCLLEQRRNARQKAHNTVASVIERQFNSISSKSRISVWDKQVLTFLAALEAARPKGMLLNEISINTLARWRSSVANQRGSVTVGRKRSIQEVSSQFTQEELKRRPDGLVFDMQTRTIFVIEIARTGDDVGSLRNRKIKKALKYASIVDHLRTAFAPCKVEPIILVIGVLGSIDESGWRQALATFGLRPAQQNKLIRRCMIATIEGTHSVLRSGDNSQPL